MTKNVKRMNERGPASDCLLTKPCAIHFRKYPAPGFTLPVTPFTFTPPPLQLLAMGKWTLNHQDDVLRDKIKTLVVGAVQRVKSENHERTSEPTITYEAFVEELDAGDSFTATLIDILVKEVADRRTRPRANDRRMISDRTAKALRSQTHQLPIYTHRLTSRRYTADFILHPDIEHSEEEEESAELRETIESSRPASALYEAYAPFHSFSSRSFLDSTDRLRSTVTSPRPTSPSTPFIGGDLTGIPPPPPLSYIAPAGPSSLGRRRTIRRPGRSTTMDFDDFTSRRRSIVRQHVETSEPVRAEDSADGTWRFSSSLGRPSPSEPASSSTYRLSRRSLPLSSWSDPHLRIDPDNDDVIESTATDGAPDAEEPSGTGHQSSSQLWHRLTGRPYTDDRSGTVVPRLRRGGQPAPESMFPRYASLVTESSTPRLDGPAGATEDRVPSRASSSTSASRIHSSEMDALDEVSRQLLTPRSISPAEDAFRM
ncbi:hypothetical protein PHLGIDRAFT_127086 [Phlebiopsis gigantea 11061_1 CR5-6]|uniref:Uncharacterized protein n=1 Tax=Phlebiopsis gigantea (strain 11061_1 CR5-6) TaxID=745531 RepID=A0A0C3NT01_PHLG1|nr:hypothetical protein PHLGIDRAFT_127086 [Phlebiopsis gigantea 11061_1 CR5-6]